MNKYHTWDNFINSTEIDWQRKSFGDLFHNRQEKGRSDLSLLSVTGAEGVIDRDNLERKDTSNADKTKYLRVKKGDIVYNTMRMWQGVSGGALREGIVSPAYTVLEPKEGVDSTYAKYLVKNNLLIQKFHQYSQGLVNDTLNLKFLNLTPILIRIPTLPEQKKIASILISVDEVIENIQKQIKKFQDLKKATMNELLIKGIGHAEFKKSELGKIPKSWQVLPLGQLGSFSKGKGISKSDLNKFGVSCLRYAEIYTMYDTIVEKLASRISRKIADRSKPLKYGDIIFAGSGETVDDIGKSVAYLSEKEAYVGSDAVVFTPNSNVDSGYISFQLNSSRTRVQLRRFGQGSSVIHIYPSELKNVIVGIASREEQIKIFQILMSFDFPITKLKMKFRRIQSFKTALMQDLLIGKVRVKAN